MNENLIRILRENRLVVIGFGVLVVVVLIFALTGGEDPSEEAAPPLSGATTTTDQGLGIFDRSPQDQDIFADVPPLDCFSLLDDDEVDAALESPQIPEDERGTTGFGQGEVCTERLVADERFFVRLEPGDPADFEPGGTVLGVAGAPVTGVGEEALWFGGPGTEDEGSTGAISVRQTTPLGMLYFRMALGRPDLQSAEQLEVAKTVAAKTLARFPGMPVGAPPPLVDLCELVTDAEAEEVLAPFRDVHPATRDEVLVGDNYSGMVDLSEEGEAACNKLILAEIYIEIQQGDLEDFEPGAAMEGVIGEPVSGIGEQAVWFADVPYQGSFTAPHLRNIMSIRLGRASFRVVLALPDTPSQDQLEIASPLATSAIARITGEEPAVEAVITEPDVGEPEVGLLENLLAREQTGDWTLGEGLVATLGWLIGDVETPQVMSKEPSPFEFGDDVFTLAFDYLSANPDDPSRDEVEGLLRRLITTPGLLATTRAFEGQPPETAFRSIRVTSHDEGYRNTLDSSDYCWDVYGVEGGGCLKEVEIPDLEAEYASDYTLGRPVSDFAGAWNDSHYAAAAEAIAESAKILEDNGEMPKVVVLFTQQARFTRHFDVGDEEFCELHIGVGLQGDIKDLQQTLAYALALCLFHDEADGWWVKSIAAYLSGVIFPAHNYEHLLSPRLAAIEINSAVGERGHPDWLFWEYLHPFVGGDGGNVRIGRSAASAGDLANYSGMDILLRDFYRALTDANVPDLGFSLVPYEPKASVMQISGPLRPVTLKPKAFGVRRVRLEVVGHDYACVAITPQGDAQVLWREGREGEGGTWTNEPPSAISGESIVVVTTTSGSGFASLQVNDVGDNEDCEEEMDEPAEFIAPPVKCAFCDLSRYFRTDSG